VTKDHGGSHCEMLQRVWQELDYRIDVCLITKGGYIEHLKGRTDTWSLSLSLSLSVDMHPPPVVTIPTTVPQSLEIPEGLMNYPVLLG
jgi:hypothetical protein